MLVQAALAAARQVLSPPLRGILWKSLALTLGLLLLVWFLLTKLIGATLAAHPLSTDYPVLDSVAVFLAGAGLLVGFFYVLPAVATLVASFFVDRAAEIVEASDFPDEPPGRALAVGQAFGYGLRFAGLTLLVNLVALMMWFVPGINVAAFFVANTYLLGRTYFELAAARYRPIREAEMMRRDHRGTVLAGGAILAGLLLVPILNLLTPIYGVALMVHVHKRLSGFRPLSHERGAGGASRVMLGR
jgi:CysZ protein